MTTEVSGREPRIGALWRLAAPTLTGPEPEPWMDDAVCAETDPEAFFPNKGGSTKAAKTICASCPVRAQCLEFAMGTKREQVRLAGNAVTPPAARDLIAAVVESLGIALERAA